MEVTENANLTLNLEKCIFGKSEIKFWVMPFTSKGVKLDPEKVKALEKIKPPVDKGELKYFIRMMQSNSDFIPSFAKVVARLRKLIKRKAFVRHVHQETFDELLKMFSVNLLLSYFDMTLPTYIFTDAIWCYFMPRKNFRN